MHPTSVASGQDQAVMGNLDTSTGSAPGWIFDVGDNTGVLTFYMSAHVSGNYLAVATPANTVDATEHRVCFSYDATKAVASRVTFVVDDVAVTQSSYTVLASSLSSAVVNTKPFCAASNGAGGPLFKGTLFDLDVWNGVASLAQMK